MVLVHCKRDELSRLEVFQRLPTLGDGIGGGTRRMESASGCLVSFDMTLPLKSGVVPGVGPREGLKTGNPDGDLLGARFAKECPEVCVRPIDVSGSVPHGAMGDAISYVFVVNDDG